MDIKEYFESAEGTGIFATADSKGKVDVAIYARPHAIDSETVAFIMAEHLSHENIQSNPNAAYLFIEKGEGYKGIRLHLTMQREEKNSELLFSLRRRKCEEEEKEKNLFLVFFTVEKIRPLVGG